MQSFDDRLGVVLHADDVIPRECGFLGQSLEEVVTLVCSLFELVNLAFQSFLDTMFLFLFSYGF